LDNEVPRSWDDKRPDLKLIAQLNTNLIIWGGNYFNLPVSRGWLAWIKRDAPPSMGNVELAWTNQDVNTRFIDCTISETNKERVSHPTQKPLRVMTWCLSFFPDAQTILDPFMGSGTTLRAAKDLGRKAIGIEIEEKYCEIAVKRLAQEVLF
jgi:DNA modification methylase